MPRRTELDWNPAAELTAMLGAAPLRVALLVFLSQHPEGAKVAELAGALGVAQPTVRGQLKSLMEAGAVSNDTDPYFSPMGQRARYFVDRDALVRELRAFAEQLGLVLLDPRADPPSTVPGSTAVTATLDTLQQLLDARRDVTGQ